MEWDDLWFDTPRDATLAAVQDSAWQSFRISLKGTSTQFKLARLRRWLADHNASTDAKLQVGNYVKALLRGGQLRHLFDTRRPNA